MFNPDLATQVWIISWAHAILVFIVCYQTYMLTRLVAYPNFGVVDILAWMLFLGYRFYGMWGLSDQIKLAQDTGFISDRFTFSQWVSLSGTTIFLVLKIISKHMERRAIKQNWGI